MRLGLGPFVEDAAVEQREDFHLRVRQRQADAIANLDVKQARTVGLGGRGQQREADERDGGYEERRDAERSSLRHRHPITESVARLLVIGACQLCAARASGASTSAS